MAELLNAIASILWPLVVAGLLVALFPVIKKLLSQSDSIDVEVAGAKVSVQRASEELRKLVSDLQDRVNELEAAQNGPLADASPPALVPESAAASNAVLWVDDRLEANVYERARLTDAGRRVVQAESTRSALESIHRAGPFGLIVSDMTRVEEGGRLNVHAGLDLLHEIRKSGIETPVVFYSSSRSLDAVRSELDRAENVAYTTSPSELMRLLQVSSDD